MSGYWTPRRVAMLGKVRPSWAAGAGLWRDFRRSAAGVTDTHGQTIYADDAAGAWSPFAPNVLVRTSRGLQTTPTYVQYAVNPSAPANQTISLATTGTYTLWIEGTGSVAVAANTAVGSGFGSATAGAPVTFTITTGGTVNLTVTGSPTLVQVINKGFVLPPVYSAMTVAGNQQVISGLGTQLAGGVYGFVQVDVRGATANGDRLICFTDGTTANRAMIRNTLGNWVAQLDAATVNQAAVSTTQAVSTGRLTFAFAFGGSYVNVRLVGTAAVAAYPAVTYPALSQVAFGGEGPTNVSNSFINTRLLALWYGQPDATKFDAAYAKAELAHALAA